MRLISFVLLMLIVATYESDAKVTVRLKRHASNDDRLIHSEEGESDSKPAGGNFNFFEQEFRSMLNPQQLYNFGENQLLDRQWQKYIPNYGNYNNHIPGMQYWQMYVPQNSWNGQNNFNGYQEYPNYDMRPEGNPWNWNPQVDFNQHPNMNYDRPWNEIPPPRLPFHHRPHHHRPHHHGSPPNWEQFPDNHSTESTYEPPYEATRPPVFPSTSKPPDATTTDDKQETGNKDPGDKDEVFDIDIRSGFH